MMFEVITYNNGIAQTYYTCDAHRQQLRDNDHVTSVKFVNQTYSCQLCS